MDKLTEFYAIRIPEKTKRMIDSLPAEWQRRLRDELRLTMAKVLHEYRMWKEFKPEEYFRDDIEVAENIEKIMEEIFGEDR